MISWVITLYKNICYIRIGKENVSQTLEKKMGEGSKQKGEGGG